MIFWVLFTKLIKIWGVPEMGDWKFFAQLKKFQVKNGKIRQK